MSILTSVLEEELDRLNRQEVAYKEALSEALRGYISKKNIRGKTLYYLQWREGQKVVSKHISKGDLPGIESQVEHRKQLENSLRRVKIDQKKLRKVLK